MQDPPILTKREQDLLPYLVSGATRSEISSTLGISEETVKWHTRQLLKKFNVKSVAEGFKRMNEYNAIFSDDGLAFTFFLESLTHAITLHDNLKDAYFQKAWIVRVVRDGEIMFRHLQHIDGKIRNIRVNGEASDNFEVEDDVYLHKNRSSQFHIATSSFAQVFDCEYVDVYPQNIEFHSTKVGHPTGEMTLRINFPLGKSPVKTWFTHTFHGKEQINPENTFRATQRFAELKIPDTKFHEEYSLFWQWET